MAVDIRETENADELYDRNIFGYDSLPIPRDIIEEIPMSERSREIVIKSRRELENILLSNDSRLVVITGPCSIHNLEGGLEFAQGLVDIQEEVKDKILILMRTYFEKPRTCVGWTGLIDDPDLDYSYDMARGLRTARQFLSDVSDMGLACATEFVGEITPQYIGDLISWAAIGARTTESPYHRRLSSGLSMPVGFKNNTAGDLSSCVDAAKAARYKHAFYGIDLNGQLSRVRTRGNAYTHVVLRGGNGVPNCKPEDVDKMALLLKKAGIEENIIVDCSHGNSNKKYEKQEEVAYRVIEMRNSGKPQIKGIMLEANVLEGSQTFPTTPDEIARLSPYISITDGCISEETNYRIIKTIYDNLKIK